MSSFCLDQDTLQFCNILGLVDLGSDVFILPDVRPGYRDNRGIISLKRKTDVILLHRGVLPNYAMLARCGF